MIAGGACVLFGRKNRSERAVCGGQGAGKSEELHLWEISGREVSMLR